MGIRRYFKGGKLARMSNGTYCIIRDLGLVKGGKGLRHHECLLRVGIFSKLVEIFSASPNVARHARPGVQSAALTGALLHRSGDVDAGAHGTERSSPKIPSHHLRRIRGQIRLVLVSGRDRGELGHDSGDEVGHAVGTSPARRTRPASGSASSGATQN